MLSMSKGIVHPYYVSALAPGAGAMAARAPWRSSKLQARRLDCVGHRAGGAAPCAARWPCRSSCCTASTTCSGSIPVLVGGGALGVGAARGVRASCGARRSRSRFCLLLVAPTAYATTTWLAPVEGTFPAAGPKPAAGAGGIGVGATRCVVDRALLGYVAATARAAAGRCSPSPPTRPRRSSCWA